jgi:hypothetical protein
MGKKKERKLKRKMEEQARRVPLSDMLDDEDREQVEPREEPLPDDQDEQWAFPDYDKRVTVSTRGKGDE